MQESRIISAFFLTFYTLIRITWEVAIFHITMSPLYAIFNLTVLIPILLVLSYTTLINKTNKKIEIFLSLASFLYISGYFFLGIRYYPLLLTFRIDPKAFFIDYLTLCLIITSIIINVSKLCIRFRERKN
jgi:hypothetical protein